MQTSPHALELTRRLGAVVLRLPEPLRPRFLALLERRAADRYDIERHFPRANDEASTYAPLVAEVAGAYMSAFEGQTRRESYALQAFLERAGAATWRDLAARDADPSRRAALLECAALEEASAEFLEALP
jgi:hypothetical protein